MGLDFCLCRKSIEIIHSIFDMKLAILIVFLSSSAAASVPSNLKKKRIILEAQRQLGEDIENLRRVNYLRTLARREIPRITEAASLIDKLAANEDDDDAEHMGRIVHLAESQFPSNSILDSLDLLSAAIDVSVRSDETKILIKRATLLNSTLDRLYTELDIFYARLQELLEQGASWLALQPLNRSRNIFSTASLPRLLVVSELVGSGSEFLLNREASHATSDFSHLLTHLAAQIGIETPIFWDECIASMSRELRDTVAGKESNSREMEEERDRVELEIRLREADAHLQMLTDMQH